MPELTVHEVKLINLQNRNSYFNTPLSVLVRIGKDKDLNTVNQLGIPTFIKDLTQQQVRTGRLLR